jgi:hypothetical protein
MKAFLFFILISSFLTALQAQEKAFAIWQGFEHKWAYNHRLNRMGDYISQGPYQKLPHVFTSVHTGATGLGKDTAIFRSYFATVRTKDLDFFPGVLKIKLQGKQGDICQVNKRVYIVNAALAKQPQLGVIFNGLDLVSESGADKLQLLKIQFSDPVRRNMSDTIDLTLQAAIIVDCRSFECNRFNKLYDYDLHVHYLVLGGKMRVSSTDYNESVIWSKQETCEESIYSKTVAGNTGYKNAFLAFKNIFIVLNQDHWILSYANAITRADYNNLSGSMCTQHVCYIRQWETGMKQVSSQSKFSEKRPGWGMLQGTMQLIQFNNGNISYFERNGDIGWDGDNQSADTDQSVNLEKLEIK